MKKSTISIVFDAEKLGAIKQYMGKKEAELEKELEDAVQKLYEKFVPVAVREYIEAREASEQEKPKASAKKLHTDQAGIKID
ncbi:hypothetical protein Cpap_0170 [Ruminiclostridium papyrosolvens DSM 2782]|uniref:Uncharacterized protein n=1 Tax=Ruminiclostridium papyrosolvens DSM 2782 TaxID=588581 RepID=F1TII6_9FIRM|nr:DUF6103 family protein [Ruminiclostridium papyrosolvens]EGD45803.1 hypothetical protein Cpap_0170 [Ruminiclostridium papyrosolvens DSM 2782]WES33878.1 DUF6103 family protein [Ruminiclostridium papyrosolvens DSM 2782]